MQSFFLIQTFAYFSAWNIQINTKLDFETQRAKKQQQQQQTNK